MSLQSMFRPCIASSSKLTHVYRRYASAPAAPATEMKEGVKAKSFESKPASASAASKSSCAPDTILTGVNYLKAQPPVVALADDAYPEWLWTILQPKVYEDDGPGGKKERVERRNANRKAIKDRNFMQTQ